MRLHISSIAYLIIKMYAKCQVTISSPLPQSHCSFALSNSKFSPRHGDVRWQWAEIIAGIILNEQKDYRHL